MSRFSLHQNDKPASEIQRPTQPVTLGDRKTGHDSLIEAAMQAVESNNIHHFDEGNVTSALEAWPQTLLNPDDTAAIDVPIEPVADRWLDNYTPCILTAEHYEILKANLWARYSETTMQIILFVGAGAKCGTSTAAANFAALLAQEPGAKVLLIDANLRSSERDTSLSTNYLDTAPRVSLVSGAPQSPVYPVPGSSNLYLLPSGTKCSMPLSLFQPSAFDKFLRTARERFQYVVIDAPPLQGYPESLVLSGKADGVILVVEAEKTRKQNALWAKQQIESAGGRLLGVVLNKRKYYIPKWLYERI